MTLHPPSEDAAAFKQFKVKFNRYYASREEEQLRYENFVASMETARRLNEQHKGYCTFGINQFSDYTLEEFGRTHGGLRNPLPHNESVDKIEYVRCCCFSWLK